MNAERREGAKVGLNAGTAAGIGTGDGQCNVGNTSFQGFCRDFATQATVLACTMKWLKNKGLADLIAVQCTKIRYDA